jgi:putative oxidoreductase
MSATSTIERPAPATARPPGPVQRVVARVAERLAAHSVDWLRISLGLVILGFGTLKYFPGASPAEDLAMRTTDALTFGLVSGTAAVVGTAIVETVIGLTLLTGVGLRVGLVAMAGWLVGIMAPVVLFAGEMFPGGLPTLEAQYVLKDVILAAAAAVVAARALGARYVVADPASPGSR